MPLLPITLYVSRRKILILLVISVAFTATGIWMIAEGNALGYVVVGFFCLCSMVLPLQYLRNLGDLALTAEGFALRNLDGKGTLTQWRDVERFFVTRISFRTMVAFDYAPHFKRLDGARRIARGLTGVEAALPDTYGMKPEALADLLNSLRDRYAGSS